MQTFLFAVPRLLDILGANTLLGETLRCGLHDLAVGRGGAPGFQREEKFTADLPEDSLPDNLPICSGDDPLTKSVGADSPHRDDPKHFYSQGILARDGGHFRALFTDDTRAKAFADKASAFIRRELPGLRFEVSVAPAPPPLKAEAQKTTLPVKTAQLLGLPALQVCEQSGRGIASETWRYTDPDTQVQESHHISRVAVSRKERGRAFRDAEGADRPHDIASLVTDSMMLSFGGTSPPQTFNELCDGQYLALIHTDGNGIGAWSKRVRDSVPEGSDLQSFIDREAAGERFYHAMRVAVRRAVRSAIQTTFHDAIQDNPEKSSPFLPYRLLMLGGDDLLLACRAEYALEFVKAYAKELAEFQSLPDIVNGNEEMKPLTVGIGVAIAKPSFPFHRLHQIAEELASSAKRLVRGEKAIHGSVVDWAICSESWMNDVQAARASSLVDCGDEILALSGKPYFVLDSAISHHPDEPKSPTLESLFATAALLEKMPRSQRRALVGELRRGRRHADLCARELKHSSPVAWEALEEAGLVEKDNSSALLWHEDSEHPGHYVTPYADLVEITELPLLKLGGEQVIDRTPGQSELETAS
ncbi:Cas10/Cmr2 second palm domain-containing protein [Methylomagnum sp.]